MLCVLFIVVGVEQRAKKEMIFMRGKTWKTRYAGNVLCKRRSNSYLYLECFKTVRDGSEDFENNRRNWRILTALNLEGVSKDRQLGARGIRVIL